MYLQGVKRLAASLFFVVAGVPILLPSSALSAQSDVEILGRRLGGTPPPGYYELVRSKPNAFQFAPSGWTRRARAVSAERNRLRSMRDGRMLAMEMVSPAVAVSGDLNVPTLMVMFANTDSAALNSFASQSTMQSRLFETEPARPYSIHTYYKELSNDLLRVNGTVYDWVRLSNNDTFYEGGCNGLCGTGEVRQLIAEGISALDATVDFGLFDNDGPDNDPNSGDDDGEVDVLVILHAEVDGACGTDNIWAHKSSLGSLGTNDPAAGGGTIQINNYVIQGGQGGDACTPGQPVAMGIAAHELGHALNLPDLYDTSLEPQTQGIGEWGLMGAGNWQIPTRPVHMTAWSKADLGWVTEVIIDSDTVLDISPIVTLDTSYVLPIENTDEYFILSNRQPLLSDQSLTSGPTPLGPGLLVWHVDSVLMANRRFFNSVNAASPHALSLEQADGLLDLENSVDRGDPGDAFPGSNNNSSFSFDTNPSSSRNDGLPSYVRVLDITQVVTNGAIQATVSFLRPTTITLSHPFAQFRVDGTTFTEEFLDFFDGGTTLTLSIDAVQTVDNGNRRYTFVSWSDGGARNHDLVVTGVGESVLGLLSAEFMVQAAVSGNGTVTSPELSAPLAGALMAEGSNFSLRAVPDMGNVFVAWSGDTTSTQDSIAVPNLAEPFSVTATFHELLAIADAAPPDGIMGADYEFAVAATGGDGNYVWTLSSGSLPSGLTLRFTGAITGVPEESGSFNFSATVRSGPQVRGVDLSIVISTPQLATSAVVGQLLGTSSLLSSDERRFLDLLGNGNGSFDLGDFLAWVENTGAISAEVMAQLMRATGGREGGGR